MVKKIVCFRFIPSDFSVHVNKIILKGKRTTQLQIDIIKLLSTVSKDVSTPFWKVGEIKSFHQLKFYSVFSYSTFMYDLLLKTSQIQKIYGNIKIFVLKISRHRIFTMLTFIFQTLCTVNSLFTGFRKWSASIWIIHSDECCASKY